MRFGFWFDYDQTYTFVALFNELKTRIPGARASGFVVNDRYFAYAVDNLPPGTNLTSFYDLVANGAKHVPDAAALAEFRVMDERHSLSRVAYSDRHLQSWSYDQLIGMYVFLIDAFREYIDREKPDVFLFDCIASQYAHLLYLVLVEKGVKVIIPTQVGVENFFFLADNVHLNFDRLCRRFDAMQKGTDAPSAEERAWAETFVSRIRRGERAYRNPAVALEQRKFSLTALFKPLRAIAYLKNYYLYDRQDPTLQNPWQRVLTIFRLRKNRKMAHRYFHRVKDIEGDFIIYLLHFEPEIATLVLSQYEQKSFIDIIVRQLPLSTRLVVKEHPAMLGQRDWRFYEELATRYPNLVLADPHASTNELVGRARAVVTLSGTTIIESFAAQRPVIFTSRSRFGGFGFGAFTEAFLDFRAALSASRDRMPSENDVINMLAAISRESFRCKFVEPLADPEVIGQENIEKIATAVIKYLNATAIDAHGVLL